MTPQTVSESFVKWMEDNNYGTFNDNIFLNQVPDFDSDNNPINDCWWVITSGGSVTTTLVTAQRVKQYSIRVFYRNPSSQLVEHNLFALESQVNAQLPMDIDNFELFNVSATMAQDGDRDAEGRRQGSLTVALQIYRSDV